MVHFLHHADHLNAFAAGTIVAGNAEAASHDIHRPELLARQGAVHDAHPGASSLRPAGGGNDRLILAPEVTARQEGNAQRGEVAGADGIVNQLKNVRVSSP